MSNTLSEEELERKAKAAFEKYYTRSKWEDAPDKMKKQWRGVVLNVYEA